MQSFFYWASQEVLKKKEEGHQRKKHTQTQRKKKWQDRFCRSAAMTKRVRHFEKRGMPKDRREV